MRLWIKAAVFTGIAIAITGNISSCSLPGSNFTVTQSEVDAARAAYDAAFLTPAAHYRSLGYCGIGKFATLMVPCADRAVVAKLQAADQNVQTAEAALQAQITAGNTSGISAAYQALVTAVNTAEALTVSLGVK